MFPNLPASRKLLVLCAMFITAVGVTTYSLVAEKFIAIEFAKKELVGSQYLTTVRKVYDDILMLSDQNVEPGKIEEVLTALQEAEASAGGRLQTAELQKDLAAAVRKLAVRRPAPGSPALLDALAKARVLAVRIGDDSNLTLDPDLDTYYLQTIIVNKLPDILGRLGRLQDWAPGIAKPGLTLNVFRTRELVLDRLLRSDLTGVGEDLERAYRGNRDGKLKPETQPAFATMMRNIDSYLGEVSARIEDDSSQSNDPTVALSNKSAVASSIDAWTVAQSELDRLLNRRIDGLFGGMEYSLILTGVLAALSIFVAMLTYRHFVLPLERLEATAREISNSKDYTLRITEAGGDEIGALAKAFNEMLSELDASREREMSEQLELARIQRMTTLGAMTASVAHEINQPLAAIVTNSNAATRWLNRAEPDLDEVRSALKRIVDDGHRASQVIASIRATFKKDGSNKISLSVNDLIGDVLRLSGSNLRKYNITIQTHLSEELPEVVVDQIQLQQVLLNLITNAADAMTYVTFRPRVLRVSSELEPGHKDNILITVEDTGTGIAKKDQERIFDALFTTKTSGMGMGLFICRSIVESHDGRLWASPGAPFGTKFFLVLPVGRVDDA